MPWCRIGRMDAADFSVQGTEGRSHESGCQRQRGRCRRSGGIAEVRFGDTCLANVARAIERRSEEQDQDRVHGWGGALRF